MVCNAAAVSDFDGEREILDWLVAKGREAEPWFAIDDASWQFPVHTE